MLSGESLNFRKIIPVGFLLAVLIFSFVHLSMAGSKYCFLTTSDSGFFYDIACDIEQTNGMVERINLSHPPQGNPVSLGDQFQPLVAVLLYRATHAINESVELEDVIQYFAPFIFALSLIPIFLSGRELGGNLAGCASAFFASVLVSSIYWMKIGAFDREPMQLLLGAWVFYLLIKMFRTPGRSALKYMILSGLVYGLFFLTWRGALYIGPIVIGAILLVFLNWILTHWGSARTIEGRILAGLRSNAHHIAGGIGMIVIASLIAVGLGGYNTMFWVPFTRQVLGFIGIELGGDGGVSFPRYAGEMAPPESYFDSVNSIYGGNTWLTICVLLLATTAVLKVLWTRKREELILLPWLVVILALPTDQARFFRLWWPMLPLFAGFGLSVLLKLTKRSLMGYWSQASRWARYLQRPLVIALAVGLLMTPFITNARANATDAWPAPHGGSLPGTLYDSMLHAFEWIQNNTPENSIVAIEWSYGHFLTGAARRPTVTDGAEIRGEEGVWENKANVKPPDYIWYRIGDKGYIYGVNAPIKEWNINGRRIDVRRLYTIWDDNEFAWILKTYRDEYDIQVDYIVVDSFRFLPAWQGFPGGELTLDVDGKTITFDPVTRTTKMDNKLLEGFFFMYVPGGGFPVYSFLYYDVCSNPPDIPKALLVYYNGRQIVKTELGDIPMVVRMMLERKLPSYLEKVYVSPERESRSGVPLVLIYKVIHEPEPISPENWTNDSTPIFKWVEPVGRVRYEIQVDNERSFSPPFVYHVDNAIGGEHESLQVLPDGKYYWRIRSFDDENNPTKWSSTMSFTVDTTAPSQPHPIEPTSDSTLDNNIVTFRWSAVEDAEGYDLIVDNDESFSSPVVDEEGLPENSYTSEYGLKNDNYWWKVRARDVAGNVSEWSDSWKFEVRALPPKPPSLKSPENGATIGDNTPTFDWSDVEGAFRYHIQVDDNSGFSSPEIDEYVTPSTFTASRALADGDYWWRVEARDSAGNVSGWSDVWTFKIATG